METSYSLYFVLPASLQHYIFTLFDLSPSLSPLFLDSLFRVCELRSQGIILGGYYSASIPFFFHLKYTHTVLYVATSPILLIGYVPLEGTTEGSVANYSCEQGYWLFGREERTCLQNAQWSGTEPHCVDGMVSSNTIQCSLSIYTGYNDG